MRRPKSLLKILLNIIFNKLGFTLVSCFVGNEFVGYKLRTYTKPINQK